MSLTVREFYLNAQYLQYFKNRHCRGDSVEFSTLCLYEDVYFSKAELVPTVLLAIKNKKQQQQKKATNQNKLDFSPGSVVFIRRARARSRA